jgi:hypothetical protein
MHCASLNAASIHAAVSAAISDGIDSQLRFCARALLSLTCFLWGSFGAHPAKWSWVHLEHLLANPDPSVGSSPVGRVFATEVYMKNVALLRRLQPHCPTANGDLAPWRCAVPLPRPCDSPPSLFHPALRQGLRARPHRSCFTCTTCTSWRARGWEFSRVEYIGKHPSVVGTFERGGSVIVPCDAVLKEVERGCGPNDEGTNAR